jgi:hypothetical protein
MERKVIEFKRKITTPASPKESIFDKTLSINLKISEISNAIFGGCSTFYCPDPDDNHSWSDFSVETIGVENGANTCHLYFTEYFIKNRNESIIIGSYELLCCDVVIELKIGDVILTAMYQVSAHEGDAALDFQKRLAEKDFVKAAALIGCKVERRLVPVKR